MKLFTYTEQPASRGLSLLPGFLALTVLFGSPLLGLGGGNDETLGGLPKAAPGDGGDAILGAGLWPAFYLEGPVAKVEGAVESITGRYVVITEELGLDLVRVSYVGLFEIRIDEHVLAGSEVEIGIAASPLAGTMSYAFQFGDQRTPVYSLTEGGSLELPLSRIRARGMFEQPATLHLRGQIGRRHTIQLLRSGGRFVVTQTN
jgi:hypothetical protein